MPTRAELEKEVWWGAEFEPPHLKQLGVALRAHYNVGWDSIACKGDNNHLYGYHRSRAWILHSTFSEDGADDYSVISSLDSGGGDNWLCAIDINPGGDLAKLIAMCKRLDAAVRADRFAQIREWYGNVNGDKIVDGWDNVPDRPASSDSSHLSHLHISFYRSRADWDHAELLALLIGEDEDMFTDADRTQLNETNIFVRSLNGRSAAHVNMSDTTTWDGMPFGKQENMLDVQTLKRIEAKVAAPVIDYEKLADKVVDRLIARLTRTS